MVFGICSDVAEGEVKCNVEFEAVSKNYVFSKNPKAALQPIQPNMAVLLLILQAVPPPY